MTSTSTRRLTVAQALVHYLAAQYTELDGVRRRTIRGVWGIFGHGNVSGLGQALHEYGDAIDLPFHRPQNEQAQVHLAAAYARHADRLSTYACTASVGPGSTNMVTGAALATVNRLPVLLLPSDFFANRIPDPVLQQVEHPSEHDLSVNDVFRPVSRFYTRIDRPEQLMHALPEAMRVLTDPAETGAVTISLPEDVQTEAYDWPTEMFDANVWRVRRPPPEVERVEEVAALIASARAPIVVAGGGVKYARATEALANFAERFCLPVAETQAGRGALRWDHPMAVGPVGAIGGSAANALAAEADLVLAIGTRLGDFVTASKSAFRPDATVVGLNVNGMDAHKMRAVPLIADALRGLEALEAALAARTVASDDAARRTKIASLKAAWDATIDEVVAVDDPSNLGQGAVLGMVHEVYGGDAVVINAAGSMPGDLIKTWRPTDPRSYHVEYGFSCMGYEIPAGLGVRLAEPDPDRPVVVLVGDGSYLMMNSEIVTAVAEGIDVVIVVIDNHGYQSIHGLQRSCGTPTFGVELRHRDAATGRLDGAYVAVDYAAHARAMGARAVHARTSDEATSALRAARDARGVQVVVIEVDPEKRVGGYAFGGWWDVPIAEVSEQDEVTQARERYEADLARRSRFR